MIGKLRMSHWKRILVIILVVSIEVSSTYMTGFAAKGDNERQIIVSMGDSYSSGEGIEKFYGQDEDVSKKVNNPDWLAHRSEKAWSGMLSLPNVDGVMSEHRNTNWFFVAASGATTQNIRYNFIKEYDKKGNKGNYSLEPQLEVFDELGQNKANYVTFTLGGNDVDFAGTITQCVIKSSYLVPNHLTDKLNNTWKNFFAEGGIRDKLYDAYIDIADRAGPQAQIIVVGYPKLLDTTGHSVTEGTFLNGGVIDSTLNANEIGTFSVLEALILNDAVSKFNRAIESIVNGCKGNGENICFVSVEDAFDGHEAYSSDPYINEVKLFAKSQDLKDFMVASAYSMHPNEKGARAYASCVQEKINELENVQSAGTYHTKFTLTVYDANDYIYDNYRIEINGKEFTGPFKWGLFKKNYAKIISVDEARKVKINLPKGDYSITVIDGADERRFYTKNIKIRPNIKKDELIYRTDFGQMFTQEDNKNKTDENILSKNLPAGAVEYNGHYYYLYTGGIASTYEEAVQFCNSKGGYLATLTSQEENYFVYSYISQQGCESAYFGLSDSANEGHWEWCTGEPLYYTNWHSGESNNENSNEDYALFYDKYSDGSWNDGDFGGHTVNDGNAFICEWGDYSTEQNQFSSNKQLSNERNIVLTLDTSGSMSGTPMEETKKASTNFINTVLEQDANIGIVTYDSMSNIASGFSADRAKLQNIVSELYDGGETNIEAGLRDAQWMLKKTNSKKKIIVLMSDGEPNNGLVDEDLIDYANKIKKSGTIIYTIGFFESLSERSYAQYLMERIASDGCHYEVANANELAFFFEDMADQINGQKYVYVKIACPVDVSVTFNGETLDSSEENLNSRTSFGTLTFEENWEEMPSDLDDRVKVLRLKEGADYNLKLTGTGHSIMNYTIGFMDENGDYSDLRKFENIKITRRTKIDTVATHSDDSTLNIDQDGDGKYDLKLRAEENGYGEEIVTSDWIIYVVIGAVIFIMLDIVVIVIYAKRKKKGE